MQYCKIEQFLAFAIPNINLKLRRTTDDLKTDILYTMRKNTKIRLSQRYSWVEKKYNNVMVHVHKKYIFKPIAILLYIQKYLDH